LLLSIAGVRAPRWKANRTTERPCIHCVEAHPWRRRKPNMNSTRWFRDVTADDVASVGGKNASLGEMLREGTPLGVERPDGFAVTADAYRAFLREADGLHHRRHQCTPFFELLDGADGGNDGHPWVNDLAVD